MLRSDGLSGYVLDGFGGLHPFAALGASAPSLTGSAYWPGWSIARDLVLSSDGGGYVLDGFGGVHPVGTAAAVGVSGYFRADVARGMVMTGATQGYVVFQSGGVYGFGGAPPVNLDLMGQSLAQAIG